MMLSLVGVLLFCGALCLASPVPRAAGMDCIAGSLIQETLNDVQRLRSNVVPLSLCPINLFQVSSKTTPLKNMMEMEGNLTTYMEGFIEALKSSNCTSERTIAHKLHKIQADGKSCLGLMSQNWKPVEDEDFFENLEYFLRFLNHNNFWDETE